MTALHNFNEIASMRIELTDTAPLIWREVDVPTSLTLRTLHEVIQVTMGWLDYHLWEFTLGDQRYGLPDNEDWGGLPRRNAAKTRLRDLLTTSRLEMVYEYDFGDGWRHRLLINNVRQGKAGEGYPKYIAGQYACPPEDCGGIPGFYHMLEAWADPSHPDHDEVSAYLEDWNPNEINELPLRNALNRIANKRNAVRTRLNKTMKSSS